MIEPLLLSLYLKVKEVLQVFELEKTSVQCGGPFLCSLHSSRISSVADKALAFMAATI